MASIPAAELLLHLSPTSKPLPGASFLSGSSPKPFLPVSSRGRVVDCRSSGLIRSGWSTNWSCRKSGRAPTLLAAAGVRHFVGSLSKGEGLRFAIVVARFNEVVTKLLLEGALETFKRYSVKEENVEVWWVPGSFEIPVVSQKLGKTGKYDAVLCIGAVIRGDTTHYDAVANSAASGVLSSSLNSGVPTVFAVLTCDDLDQALNRAGGKAGNKGAEAAVTAIEMASLFKGNFQ